MSGLYCSANPPDQNTPRHSQARPFVGRWQGRNDGSASPELASTSRIVGTNECRAYGAPCLARHCSQTYVNGEGGIVALGRVKVDTGEHCHPELVILPHGAEHV